MYDLFHGFHELILIGLNCFLFFLIDFFNIRLINNAVFLTFFKEKEEDEEAVEKAKGLKLVSITSLCNDDS
jgi:hypothetical protein